MSASPPKSALARQGSMNRLHGPRSLGVNSGTFNRQKTVTFDKTDEVIQYDTLTPEIPDETWEHELREIDLESCDTEGSDLDMADGANAYNAMSDLGASPTRRKPHQATTISHGANSKMRPLPKVPPFILPHSTKNPSALSSELPQHAPVPLQDEIRVASPQVGSITSPALLQSPILPDLPLEPEVKLSDELQGNRLPLEARIDAVMDSIEPYNEAFRRTHRLTRSNSNSSWGSQSSLVESIAYERMISNSPAVTDDEFDFQSGISQLPSVQRQESLLDSQRQPSTQNVSHTTVPSPGDALGRTYSKRRSELMRMLDARQQFSAGPSFSSAIVEEDIDEDAQSNQSPRLFGASKQNAPERLAYSPQLSEEASASVGTPSHEHPSPQFIDHPERSEAQNVNGERSGATLRPSMSVDSEMSKDKWVSGGDLDFGEPDTTPLLSSSSVESSNAAPQAEEAIQENQHDSAASINVSSNMLDELDISEDSFFRIIPVESPLAVSYSYTEAAQTTVHSPHIPPYIQNRDGRGDLPQVLSVSQHSDSLSQRPIRLQDNYEDNFGSHIRHKPRERSASAEATDIDSESDLQHEDDDEPDKEVELSSTETDRVVDPSLGADLKINTRLPAEAAPESAATIKAGPLIQPNVDEMESSINSPDSMIIPALDQQRNEVARINDDDREVTPKPEVPDDSPDAVWEGQPPNLDSDLSAASLSSNDPPEEGVERIYASDKALSPADPSTSTAFPLADAVTSVPGEGAVDTQIQPLPDLPDISSTPLVFDISQGTNTPQETPEVQARESARFAENTLRNNSDSLAEHRALDTVAPSHKHEGIQEAEFTSDEPSGPVERLAQIMDTNPIDSGESDVAYRGTGEPQSGLPLEEHVENELEAPPSNIPVSAENDDAANVSEDFGLANATGAIAYQEFDDENKNDNRLSAMSASSMATARTALTDLDVGGSISDLSNDLDKLLSSRGYSEPGSYTLRDSGSLVVASSPQKERSRNSVIQRYRDGDPASQRYPRPQIPAPAGPRPVPSSSILQMLQTENKTTSFPTDMSRGQDLMPAPPSVPSFLSDSSSQAIPSHQTTTIESKSAPVSKGPTSMQSIQSAVSESTVREADPLINSRLRPRAEAPSKILEASIEEGESKSSIYDDVKQLSKASGQSIATTQPQKAPEGEFKPLAGSDSITNIQDFGRLALKVDDSQAVAKENRLGENEGSKEAMRMWLAKSHRMPKVAEGEQGRLYIRLGRVWDVDIPGLDSENCTYALTLDNGTHCITTPHKNFDTPIHEEYGFVLCEKDHPNQTVVGTFRATSNTAPTGKALVGSDGSFARFNIPASELQKTSRGVTKKHTVWCMNEWSPRGGQGCRVEYESLFIPRLSRQEQLPFTMRQAEREIQLAHRTQDVRKTGELIQFGGDCSSHAQGKKRWFILDGAGCVLVAHSSRSHRPRAVINLSKARQVLQLGAREFMIEFSRGQELRFKSPVENADDWIKAVNAIKGAPSRRKPYLNALLYEVSE